MAFDSTDDPEFTVTGKPLSYYEPYFELVTQLLANGLALATDRNFLSTLDPAAPSVEEAVRRAGTAKTTIQWRMAHAIDEIEAHREAERAALADEASSEASAN